MIFIKGNFPNRTANASCLIYDVRMDEDNKEFGIMEFWSDKNPEKGDLILANQQALLKVQNIQLLSCFTEILLLKKFWM
jgi:hypothetical protein